jgi:UDP-glucose 4-epimerase
MKVLVTGGVGLIGQEAVRQLLEKGHEVNVLDVWDPRNENTTHFKGSVLKKEDILKAMEGCDYVMHLAAVMGVANTTKKPLECLDVNILGTRTVLECCVEKNIKKIVFSSSSEVYGEPKTVPVLESNTLRPKSEYGISKVVGEEYVKAFSIGHGLDYSIVRFFNVYGPMQTDKFVIPMMMRNTFFGKPIQIYGDGSQVRAFCYVKDAVNGMITALFDERANNKIMNIGNPEGKTSIKELAEKIVEITGNETQIEYVAFGDSDRSEKREIFNRIPDISKAKDTIEYEPKYSLDDGLKEIYNYYKANPDWVKADPDWDDKIE